MSGEPTLLRDLIDIPERVQTNDFVLRLSDGVTAEGDADDGARRRDPANYLAVRADDCNLIAFAGDGTVGTVDAAPAVDGAAVAADLGELPFVSRSSVTGVGG